MKRTEGFWSVFFVVASLSILILILSFSGKLKFLSFLEKPAVAIQSFSYNLLQKLPFISESEKIKKLENEKLELLSRISDFEKLKLENQALSDQFQINHPSSSRLLGAEVIGAQSFIPNLSLPTTIVINKGIDNNLKVGQAIILKNNLVGVVTQISANLSKVDTIYNPSFSFTVKTEKGAMGIIKGGESPTMENILLSENIKSGELVLTRGNIDGNNIGIPPDLVVGKTISIEKNPSELFQKAKIESFVNFMNLSMVFVYLQ